MNRPSPRRDQAASPFAYIPIKSNIVRSPRFLASESAVEFLPVRRKDQREGKKQSRGHGVMADAKGRVELEATQQQVEELADHR
jgi:hypothetical protein